LLLAARDEDGTGMSDDQLLDEIRTAVFAGYDSTATGLAFTLYLLATHPESARRARQEAHQVVPDGLPTWEQLGSLDYIGRVFQEGLRLYPPLSFHPRMALENDVIGSRRIPAGATLLYSNYAPGRNPEFWQHPDSFDPDHFLPEQVARRHRFAYQPFAAGPRVCIGLNMAIMEAKIVLSLLLQKFDLVRAVNTPVMQARSVRRGPAEAFGLRSGDTTGSSTRLRKMPHRSRRSARARAHEMRVTPLRSPGRLSALRHASKREWALVAPFPSE
jgi:cytochrome P450